MDFNIIGKILRSVGGVAGIGGVSLTIVLFIYRDILKSTLFPTVSPTQATILVGSIIGLTFLIAIIGVYASIVANVDLGAKKPLFFIILVGVIFVFLLLVLYMFINWPTYSVSSLQGRNPLFEGYTLLRNGELEKAEKKIDEAHKQNPASPEPLYWKAMVAIEKNNIDIALIYANKALELNKSHSPSLYIKIKLLLIKGSYSINEAKYLLYKSHGISDIFDKWIKCIEESKLLFVQFLTSDEIDKKCYFPIYNFNAN